jgi:DNA polymerase III alpha subunit (gram-positive type)
MRFVSFDIEYIPSSHGKRGRLLELSAFEFNEKGEYTGALHLLVDPGEPIPRFISNLTHITDEMVAGKSTEANAAAAFKAFLGKDAVLIGQNGDDDIRFLAAIDPDLAGRFTYDTWRVAKMLYPGEKSYSLGTLIQNHGDPSWHTHAHRAWSDAWATGKIFFKMRDECENMSKSELATLRRANPPVSKAGEFLHYAVRGEGVGPSDIRGTIVPSKVVSSALIARRPAHDMGLAA